MSARTTSIFLFFLLLFLSNCFQSTSTTATLNPTRRILHQPFFPVEPSPPPGDPPSPPPPIPKYPFSGSTPDPTPFFPSYPSPPPPPAASSASPFASFPANISSLTLPHSSSSKTISKKLVAVTVALSASAVVVASIALFFYFRGRRRESRSSADDKASRSENSRGFGRENTNAAPPPPPPPPRKQRTASNNSSEFLYLGTLVNSRGVDDTSGHSDGSRARRAAADPPPRKLDSPELHPLPPLARQSASIVRQNFGTNNAELISSGTTLGEEEDEEFYSPRGSASGRESSGSGSRRLFAAVQAEKLINNNNNACSDSSTSSRSSSTTGSPARSASVSISPPVSTSPKSSKQKSPEFVEMQSPVGAPTSPSLPPLSFPHSPQPDSSPEVGLQKIKEEEEEEEEEDSPLLSNGSTSSRIPSPVESPRLSTLSALNGKVFPAEIGEWTTVDGNLQSPESSPALSSASSSSRKSSSSLRLPAFLRGGRKDSPESTRMSNSPVSLHSSESPWSSRASSTIQSPRFSSSPSRGSIKESPGKCRKSDVSAGNVRLYPASPSSGNDSGRRLRSTPASPSNRNESSNKPSPSRTGNVRAPPPPPPPPPAPPLVRRSVSPVNPSPISKPTAVTVPPSKPMELEQTTMATSSTEETTGGSEDITPKPKLKPLHWDKVRANSDREMVWDHLRSSSFKLNEEMIETLFVVKTPNSNPKETARKCVLPLPNQENRVLDPKKAQNVAILLRALHMTTEEVCEALLEGNAETLGAELLESLLKMAPTKEEERKLKEHKDDSPVKLGSAEKFLKAVIDVPFAFKRAGVMLYMANFESEVEYLKKSFDTLEATCDELRNSRMFLKLLEAVLKTGNRMNVGTNRGDAHAFKLDTLLKLVDVKGADGKTTLLHFVVQEIIRSEGSRLANANQSSNSTLNDDVKCRKLGLQVVSALSSELANVKKAAAMDSDVLSNDVSKLSQGLAKISEVVRLNEAMGLQESNIRFSESLSRFMKMAEEEIIRVQAQESVALSLVKEITEYFHGNSAKEEAHPFRIFMVVRDFLTILDRVCKEVGMINERTMVSSAHKFPVPVNPMLPVPVNPAVPQVFAAFQGRRQSGSSDDDTSL
ncbi:hypothetical protein Ancab_022250 [Ancistrocladus abbreviatus]